MKKLILLSLIVIALIPLRAQEHFYYYNNTTVPLTKTEDKYLLHIKSEFDPMEVLDNIPEAKWVSYGYYEISDIEEVDSWYEEYTLSDVFELNGEAFYETDRIIVAFNESATEGDITRIETDHNLTLIEKRSFYSIYEATNALSTANDIHDNASVKFSHADFILPIHQTSLNNPHIPNDIYFNKQFYLNNTGQVINDGETGTAGADMNLPESWDITKGDPNLVIAVIDNGVVDGHPDLPSSRQVRLPGSNFNSINDGFATDDPEPTGGNHGTAIAGIIAATQDNNIGISGIAPLCKIMPVKYKQGSLQSDLAQTITFAANNGADVISMSLGYGSGSSVLDGAIQASVNLGIPLFFPAGNTRNLPGGGPGPGGNGNNNPNGTIIFPAAANIEGTLTVGASDKNDVVAAYSPTRDGIDVTAPSAATIYGQTQYTSGFSDVWTIDNLGTLGGNPNGTTSGSNIPANEILPPLAYSGTFRMDPYNYTGRFTGTSAATPMVAGVAALLLSENNCLSPFQVTDILKQTAEEVGGYDYNWLSDKCETSKELGSGRVNAYEALLAAQEMATSPGTADLYIKDTPDEFGAEPNVRSQRLYTSKDIWVRKQADGFTNQFHENPEYSAGSQAYVYVKVRNKSCTDYVGTTGANDLKLYWSKASTALSWPSHWDGSFTAPLMGDKIGDKDINTIESGEYKIYEFVWNVPNPANYASINNEPWHFCLLARIDGTIDPMTTSEGPILWQNVMNNNNIAWKNLSVLKKAPLTGFTPEKGLGAVVAIGNDDNSQAKKIDVELGSAATIYGEHITKNAEVRVHLDNSAFQIWTNGGELSDGLKHEGDGVFLVTSKDAALKNLQFPAKERATLYLGVNFLTDEVRNTNKMNYAYYIEQRESGSSDFIGGEQYAINRETRTLFNADAGSDETINKGASVTLSATSIGEPAIYKWYNAANDKLKHTGQNYTLSPKKSGTLRLEVIAQSDGYKDYDEVNVTVREHFIVSLAPNPATAAAGNVTVNYVAAGANTAYLHVTNIVGNVEYAYPINPNATSTVIPISQYTPGNYIVSLYTNNEFKHSKTLSVN